MFYYLTSGFWLSSKKNKMLKTIKLKILYRLLEWFLDQYDPHHDQAERTHIDFTRGQVYLHIKGRRGRTKHDLRT